MLRAGIFMEVTVEQADQLSIPQGNWGQEGEGKRHYHVKNVSPCTLLLLPGMMVKIFQH
jgi:hypothetical protein